jgi:hypothetical protein
MAGDATEYSRHLFRVLDTDKDDHLSWKEVMVGFHNLSPAADKTEKLKLVFRVRNCLYELPLLYQGLKEFVTSECRKDPRI